jgi:hypothetical protein
MQVQLNKQDIDEARYKMRKFLVIKWDILKQKKKEFLQEAIQRRELRELKSEWARRMRTHEVFRLVYDRYS